MLRIPSGGDTPSVSHDPLGPSLASLRLPDCPHPAVDTAAQEAQWDVHRDPKGAFLEMFRFFVDVVVFNLKSSG